MYAQVRFYYKIPNAEDLPDERLIKLFAELQWVRQEEAKHNTPEQ
jgi:hypothetical protein